jgi:alkanesulfonate monooxygenase SsuD/methylene tetrahydromethanopterin reductase-like flavin-dependent oxidoreductase (luciferase family)
MSSAVQFGVQVSTAMCAMPELRDAWNRVEALGYSWISGQDHFYTQRAPGAGSFEGVTSHAALAAWTTRPRVGCLVYSAGYRHPAVMANAMATIDHISGGRLELGMGAGWLQAEYDDYGIEFESPAVRLRRLRESVEVIRALWTQTTVDYDGEFFSLSNARCGVRPLQSPPRIWIGAGGPRAVRLAAQIGDGWNANFLAPQAFADGVAEIRSIAPDPDRFTIGATVPLVMAETVGAVDALLRDRYGPTADAMRPAALTGSTAEVTDAVGRLVEAGCQLLVIAVRPPFDFDGLERFAADVAPHFVAAGDHAAG